VELGVMRDFMNEYKDADEKLEEELLAFGGAAMYEPDRLRNILMRCVPKR
jgi:hypothetical protein